MKYRIKEITYGDGHKEYTAQEAYLNLGLFKLWRNYACAVKQYGYATVRIICTGETYEECEKYLLESIQKKKDYVLKNKVVSTKIFNL